MLPQVCQGLQSCRRAQQGPRCSSSLQGAARPQEQVCLPTLTALQAKLLCTGKVWLATLHSLSRLQQVQQGPPAAWRGQVAPHMPWVSSSSLQKDCCNSVQEARRSRMVLQGGHRHQHTLQSPATTCADWRLRSEMA